MNESQSLAAVVAQPVPEQNLVDGQEYNVVGVLENDRIVVIATGGRILPPGTMAIVYTKGNRMKDPDTGEDLGYAEYYKGTGQVVQSDEKIAYLHRIKKLNVGQSLNNRLLKEYMDQSVFSHPWSKIPVEDVYQIDETKYMKGAFESPHQGDKARIIPIY